MVTAKRWGLCEPSRVRSILERAREISGDLEISTDAQASRLRRGTPYFSPIVLALALVVAVPIRSGASELKKQTLAAWNDYINTATACWRTEAPRQCRPFLRATSLPGARAQLQAGEITVWPETGEPTRVPQGLIHDWTAAVFIPDATLANVLAVVRDYDRYPQVYKPAVITARKVHSLGNDDEYSMVLMQKVLFVTAAVTGEYETRYFQVDAKRWYSLSHSIRLQAIQNFGESGMRVLPPDRGPGYVWRLYSLTKFEERDGGVYIEMEAFGLTRDIPFVFRWLVDPIVERLPRYSISKTLQQTREAVLADMSRISQNRR
jgi:hypothetical protein